ncbi:MAG: hypothetical protein NVSMB29_00790 [Candidatus Dormibacteria bacterium]
MKGLRAVLDERDPAGGRFKALLFLAHPGPSLLVTATTVVVAGLAAQGPVPRQRVLRLGCSMLAAQIAIGAANDWADVERDRVAKPHKPLVRGLVSRRVAALVTVGGAATSLGLAAGLGPAVAAAMTLGLGSGLGYDAGLKRNVASALTWAGGMLAVPLAASATVGRSAAPLRRLPLLAGLMATGLHCANALPDLDDDARAGVRSLPVRLGSGAAAAVALGATASAALLAYADAVARSRRRRGMVVAMGGMVAAEAVCALALVRAGSTRSALPFRVLAPASAGLASAWLATVLRSPEQG